MAVPLGAEFSHTALELGNDPDHLLRCYEVVIFGFISRSRAEVDVSV